MIFIDIVVEIIVLDNQLQPNLQQRKTRLVTKTKSTSNFGGV